MSFDLLLKLVVIATSFVGRMTSPVATVSDVTLTLSPPLCHSSPATATVANDSCATWLPRYQYAPTAPGVAMMTFRRDAAHVTGNGGGRLPVDDVSRCESTKCQTCAATRYCNCCYNQPPHMQRVADV